MQSKWLKLVFYFVFLVFVGEVVVLYMLQSDTHTAPQPDHGLPQPSNLKTDSNTVRPHHKPGIHKLPVGNDDRIEITGRDNNDNAHGMPPAFEPALPPEVLLEKRTIMAKSRKYKMYTSGILNCQTGHFLRPRPKPHERHHPLDEYNAIEDDKPSEEVCILIK